MSIAHRKSAVTVAQIAAAVAAVFMLLPWSYAHGRATTQLPPPERRFAVVIGISQYASRSLHDIAAADNDARAIQDVLTRRLGFPRSNVVVISQDRSGESFLTTRSQILRALYQTLERLPEESLLFVSYSGYAVRIGNNRYLVPSDALNESPSRPGNENLALLQETTISIDEVQRLVARSNATQAIFLFDTCFAQLSGTVVDNAPLLSWESLSARSGLSATATIYAASRDGLAYEDRRSNLGLLTSAFVDGVMGAADDHNTGTVTLGSLVDYILVEVPRRSQAYAVPQRPHVEVMGYDASDIELASTPRISSLTEQPFEIKATIRASAEVGETVSKTFRLEDVSADCNINQDRSVQFCHNEVDSVDGWDPPVVSSSNCPANASYPRDPQILRNDPKCVAVAYHLQGCGAELLNVGCKGRAWLVFDLTLKGSKFRRRQLEDYEWQTKILTADQLRLSVQYPLKPETNAKNVRFTYDVRITRNSPNASKPFSIHLDAENPEFNGMKTSISSSGTLVVDVSGALEMAQGAR